ncbi:putative malate dehydrogenase 1B [Salarias fasciatus]|uniref:putative malate dehydrogenase 1B n=1 Tax=Salarias fasciatus TaxID=181472 RepID=UPI001176EDAE|nr:putative malate dehydrogenase 1B [Salarias fasciatus]
MAKFVLAGKSDCPYFAKAELLADALQRCLPDFRVHKISVLPEDWKEWLEVTCQRNGWKHEHSPLVWRELVVQGGKGMLLGGFSDFLEHCQEYYGITSDMPTDLMLSVAAENLQAKLKQTAEEQRRVSLIQPFHIWISGALSPVCHVLIPKLLSAEVFPGVSLISLHLLDLDGTEEGLQDLRMETQDLALSILHQVTVHTNVEQAFRHADVVLLLDDGPADGESDPEEDRRTSVKKISERYREYGRLIDSRARREVKVMVSGDSFVNLRCSLLVDSACSIESRQFIAMATQLENEAKAIIAKQLNVRASDVTDVIVWGNISGIFYIDVQMAKVFNYDGAVKGPPFFWQPVLKVLHDRKWLETDLQSLAGRRRGTVTSKTGRAAGMAAANGLLAVLRAWSGAGDTQEVLSVGVPCTGHYGVPEGVVLSVPAAFREGKCSLLSELSVGDKLKERIQLSLDELLQEKKLAEGNN